MAGGFRAVVPCPVDARGRGDVLVDVVFGARGRRRALVGDEAGEQAAALAFDLRVDAPLGRGRADHGVGGCLIVCVWDHLIERKRSW